MWKVYLSRRDSDERETGSGNFAVGQSPDSPNPRAIGLKRECVECCSEGRGARSWLRPNLAPNMDRIDFSEQSEKFSSVLNVENTSAS